MKLTAIKAQVKNPERVSIYIDGIYAFSLNHVQLLEEKLHVGLEISEPRLTALKKTSDFGKAFERALMYVMLRPRSVLEVKHYARRKQWSPEDTEVIIAKLTTKNYLSDEAFARSWVQNRVLHKHVSLRKLQQELRQKGVSDSIIRRVLAASDFSEGDSLRALVAKKRTLARYQDQTKLMRYLAGQGFGYDEIKAALEPDSQNL
ncbi:MAG TPA: RecX family transcriptional regulator [Candidatus Saccharimonadales bacterium]|nr:RecX family transcriptional regulator [Candidatus Saccharimonadales bacterium]